MHCPLIVVIYSLVMAKQKPFVSICTVTYNRNHFLPILQQLILNQDYPINRLHWVIVDDSENGSEIFKPDPRLYVSYHRLSEKMTLGCKRNLSHSFCEGEFIVYMDDDDFYPPTRVSHAVQSLEESDALIVGSTLLPILFLPEREIYLSGPFAQNHATAATFAFRKKLLSQTSYLDDAISAEEKYFLKDYSIPLKQLNPNLTIISIAHSQNTFEKRKLKNPKNKRFRHLKDSNLEPLIPLMQSYESAMRKQLIQQRMPMLRVVVTTFNLEKLIGPCLASIRGQKNCRFTVDIVDDASTDATVETAIAACEDDPRFRIHCLEHNQGAMGSFWEGLGRLQAEEEDVIVWVDGDDQLATCDSLAIVASTYASTDCWLTYGSFMNSLKQRIGRPYDNLTIINNAFRGAPWWASHLKTFKLALWNQLDPSELQSSNGEWFQQAVDLAVMFPLMEMAGFHQCFIPDVVYLYNSSRPDSLSNARRSGQKNEDELVRAMPVRQPLLALPVSSGKLNNGRND